MILFVSSDFMTKEQLITIFTSYDSDIFRGTMSKQPSNILAHVAPILEPLELSSMPIGIRMASSISLMLS